MAVPTCLTRGTKPADWRYQVLLIAGTKTGYYSDKDKEAKLNSFCALVYYVHVLGDYVAIKDEHWKSFDVHATKIPFAATKSSGGIDLFSELEKHLNILFAGQTGGLQYTQLIGDIETLASKSRRVAGSVGGINTPEEFTEAHGYAIELMDVLSGSNGYGSRISALLTNEEFFQTAFPRTDQAPKAESWLDGLLSSLGFAA